MAKKTKSPITKAIKSAKVLTPDNNTPLSNVSSPFQLAMQQAEMMFPGKTEWRQKLMATMIIWSKDPTSLDLQGFCSQYDIFYDTLHSWLQKYEDMRASYEHVKLNIAHNRHNGAMTGKLTNNVYKDIHDYKKKWVETNKYNDDRAQKTDPSPAPINVYLNKPEVITKEEMNNGEKE